MCRHSEPTNALNKLCAKQQGVNVRKQEKRTQKDRGKYTKNTYRMHTRNNKALLEPEEIERKRDEETEKVSRNNDKRVEEEAKVIRDFEKETKKLREERAKLGGEYEKVVHKNKEDQRKEDKALEKQKRCSGSSSRASDSHLAPQQLATAGRSFSALYRRGVDGRADSYYFPSNNNNNIR